MKRYYFRQRLLIAFFYLLLPFCSMMSILQTPQISNFVLKVSLRWIRFRTGLKVDAADWQVNPFSLTAVVSDVRLHYERLNLFVPEIVVQLSPFAALLGHLYFYEITVDRPLVYGRMPPAWMKTNSDATFQWGKDSLPIWIEEKSKRLFQKLSSRHIGFDTLSVFRLRAELQEFKAVQGTLVLEHFGGSFFRVDFNLNDFSVPQYLQVIESLRMSVSLLKDASNGAVLKLHNFQTQLNAETGSRLSAVGQMPGSVQIQSRLDLEQLLRWSQQSEALKSKNLFHLLKGDLDVEANIQFSKQREEEVSGKINAENLVLDEYNPHRVTANIKFEPKLKKWSLENLKISLKSSNISLAPQKNSIEAQSLKIIEGHIAGQLRLNDLELCSLLYATSIRECFQETKVNGDVAVDGTFDPFVISLKPQLTTGGIEVRADSFHLKNEASKILVARPSRITGGVAEVLEKKIRFLDVGLLFDKQEIPIVTRGEIFYSPPKVNLEVQATKVNLEQILKEFLELPVSGEGLLKSTIRFSKENTEGRPETQIDGQLDISKFAISKQVLGELLGPVHYTNNQLVMGPLRLKSGGGLAQIQASLNTDVLTHKTFLNLDARLNRLEMVSRSSDDSSLDFFRGFVSGHAQLSGNTQKGQLSGPIDFNMENFQSFGIPFQYGFAKGRYEKENLYIDSVRARQGNAQVALSGILNPRGGSEINFSTESFPVRELHLDPRLEIFQSGDLQCQGYWKPEQGWGLTGTLSHMRVAGNDISDGGNILLKGSPKTFQLNLNLSKQFSLQFFGDPSQTSMEPQKIDLNMEDQGLFWALAYIKKWTFSKKNVLTHGKTLLHWTPYEGNLEIQDLDVKGPIGVEELPTSLVKINGIKKISWKDKTLIENTFQNLDAPSTFDFVGNPGSSHVDLKSKIYLPFLGLFIPGMDWSAGFLNLETRLVLPPDFSTLEGVGQVVGGSLDIKGIGQPIQQLNAKVNIENQQIEIKDAVGKLGSGDVNLSGTYRVSSKRPAVSLKIDLNRAHVVIAGDVPMDVSGGLSLTGERFPYLFKGQIYVQNGLYSREFGIEAMGAGPSPESLLPENTLLKFDIDTEVSDDFRIANTSIATRLKGRLHLAGDENSPSIRGGLDLLNGSIFANENEFHINQGHVEFSGEDFVPAVNIQASTIFKHTRDYRIDLKASGMANNLLMQFSSDPVLPTQDIVNLLAFGYMSSDVQSNGVEDVNSADRAAQAEALQAIFGKTLGNAIGTSTGFQVKVKAARNQTQVTTIPKVTVERKLSENIKATFGQSLESTMPEQDLQVDYKLLNNMNLTGVWQNRTHENREESSVGADLRFKFNVK